jgi:hypothetical protein
MLFLQVAILIRLKLSVFDRHVSKGAGAFDLLSQD